MSVRDDVQYVSVDQSIQLAADQFEIGVSGTWLFEERADLEFATVKTGLLDKNLDPHLVTHITDGVVDEVDLRVDSRSMTTVIRGRDASAYAIDTTLYIEYGGLPDPTPQVLPGPLATIPGVTTVLKLPGKWWASAIARDLCTRIGLNCNYQAPDYMIRGTFSVSGPVMAAVQELVSPFSQFEPSRVDVWTEGKTLMIRSRPGLAETPVAGAPTPQVFDIADLRVRNLNFQSSWLDAVRVIRLTGAGQGGGVCTSITEEVTEQLIFDATGTFVVTRIVERTTRRDPDGAILKVIKETYTQTPGAPGQEALQTLRLSQLYKMICDHDQLFFDEDCNLLNTPREHRQVIDIEAIDPDSTISSLQPVEQHIVTFQYDGNGFRTTQQTDKFTWNKDEKVYEPSERVTTQLKPKGILEYEQVTDTFVAGDGDWTLQSSQKSPAGGHLPAGPGRALPNNVSTKNPLFIARLIDTFPGAKDFTYSNPNLIQAQLQLIYEQARDSSFAQELEVTFTASGIPWLRKGQRIRITGLKNPADGAILSSPLDTFLVVENRVELVENRDSPTYTSRVRAVNWTQTWRP